MIMINIKWRKIKIFAYFIKFYLLKNLYMFAMNEYIKQRIVVKNLYIYIRVTNTKL